MFILKDIKHLLTSDLSVCLTESAEEATDSVQRQEDQRIEESERF